MVRRTRDIQKKIWLTPQEERTIAKKMEMIGTENFGAYARKMLIDGYIIVVDYTEQKKLAAEINKIGVNINTAIECKLGGSEIDEGSKHLLEIKRLIQEANKTERQVPLREPDLLIILTGGSMAYTRPDGVKVIPLACLTD